MMVVCRQTSDIRSGHPAGTIPIGLDLFSQWSRPYTPRYQHRFSTGSGNDGNNRDDPVRDFSFIGLFNGAPDLAVRSEEILREEFAKRADADR